MYNKFITEDGEVLLDLTDDSISASDLLEGVTAHDKSGKKITGTIAFQPAKTITPTTANQIAVSSGYYTGGHITVKGDANLKAENIKSGVSIFGVSGTLTENSGGSGEASEWSANEDALISGTISNYTNDRVSNIECGAFYSKTYLKEVNLPAVTNIGTLAFYRCTLLTSVNCPRVTKIGASAFEDCVRLNNINFPVVKSIGSRAFLRCSGLTTASFPAATSISSAAFSQCSKLTEVNFQTATSTGDYAFFACSSLTTANFPAATNIGAYAFSGCKNLTSISFPKATQIGTGGFYCCGLATADFSSVTSIGTGAFYYCSNLTSANFPMATTIERCAFQECYNLAVASFPAAVNIGGSAFSECYALSQLYLAGSSLCKLSYSDAFDYTPYKGYSSQFSGTPRIYVPSSLLTSYKAATNWHHFSSYFSAIENAGNDDTGGGDTGGDTGNTITFNVDGLSYQADAGMTWSEYIDSAWNNPFVLDNGYIIHGETLDWEAVANPDGTAVYPDDVIVGGTVYTLVAVDTSQPRPSIITFTINGKSYQADSGMTWGEWLYTPYNTSENTDGVYIYGNSIRPTSARYVATPDGSSVTVSDIIIANTAYIRTRDLSTGEGNEEIL